MVADFIRVEGTNSSGRLLNPGSTLVLEMDGRLYSIGITNFSDDDCAYVDRVRGAPVDESKVVQAARAKVQADIAGQQAEAVAREKEHQRQEAEVLKQKAQAIAKVIREIETAHSPVDRDWWRKERVRLQAEYDKLQKQQKEQKTMKAAAP